MEAAYLIFWELDNYSSSPVPDKIIYSYGRHLLPAVVFQTQRAIVERGVGQVHYYADFIQGLLDRVRESPPIMSRLKEDGTDFQLLADKFSEAVNKSTQESKYADDRSWVQILGVLKAFYKADSQLGLKRPAFLTGDWLVDLARVKTRSETRAHIVSFANELKINLP